MSETKQSFIQKYIFSTDHKVIGIQFAITGLIMLLVGGALAMLIRWQLGWPGTPLPFMEKIAPGGMPGGYMLPDFFNVLFTMHGSVMIFFAIIPMVVGAFGNYLIPLKIGAPDMAFPRLNMISFWMLPISIVIVSSGFLLESGAAGSGWTAYPPLSTTLGTGQVLWIIGVIVLGFSSIFGSVNYITTILNLRAPGMTLHRMPLAVWALLTTAILVVLATPVLASAMTLLLLDNTIGTSFFLPAGLVIDGTPLASSGGQVLMWQHLFWFYSHPAVYIMILPTMGIVSDILPVFARKPVFGYKAIAYASLGIGGLGFIVWGHHMFQSGMNPVLGTSFMVSTLIIAVPSAIKVFNWLGTIWRGNLHLTTSMWHSLAFVAMFLIGGLSGVFMASAPVDIYIHDTYFIVAHIHYVLFGGSLFGIYSGLTFWFPKMFGRMMSERLGKIHFWLTFIFFNITMFPMFKLGMAGMHRRIYDYTQYAHLADLVDVNRLSSIGAFLLGVTQLIFIANFFWSIFKGKKAPNNPWNATTLEWTTSSPPPHGNFAQTPTVYCGPYEYSVPGMSKDFRPQTEKL